MKKLLAVLSVAALLSPALAFAAKDDVSMDTSVVLTVGGYEVDISGSTATVESITVDTSSFSFGLQSGSYIQITAPDLNALSTDTTADLSGDTCTASLSSLTYTGTAARTVSVTPNATLCSAGSTGNPASSGGQSMTGGGGGNRTGNMVPVTPATPASGLSSAQVTAILNVLASFSADAATIAKVKAALEGTAPKGSVTSTAVSIFKSDLTTGSLGSEVKALQEFLNAHGYTVAKSGAGSVGNETSTFGGATRAALIKYQKAKGITPAVGYFGAKTRAAINAE
ncbi:MAG: peptidoglycan-binding domain-containing protein [Candidatus Kaiserbacteria bacterium]|nr:peptidoglycan-binding domain-containing protein [Candidatus Kaiserbacteria bacterium]